MSDDVKVLHSVVSLDYERPPTRAARRYTEAVGEKRLIAHRCPECERLYTPPKGYCPVCVVLTTDEHEIEVSPEGVLVSYTVTNPDKLHQQGGKTSARGDVMLDGTRITLMGELDGVEAADVHTGMRMRAVWVELEDGRLPSSGGWGAVGIKGWEPTGEPDASREEVQELLKKAGES